VLEHIKDQDHTSFDDLVLFNFSGARAFVSEMARVTRPGGKLILTTPNPCSLFCFERLMGMNSPWLFPQHVREYSPTEILELFGEFGFELECHTTMYAAYYFDMHHRQMLLDRYFPDEEDRVRNRGDDALYIFRRV
jgi:SAM-dependent methyltransferase